MKEGITWILFILLLIPTSGFGQNNIKPTIDKSKDIKLISKLDLLYNVPKTEKVSILKQRSIFDANKLPLFCKIEHKLSKKSNVNLRMRLGSLDYVNKLEGKN